MNFQFYLEKLIHSKEFQKFKKENPKAFLCSGFFSIDKKAKDNQQHLDYFIPSLNKMFSFKLNQNPVEMMPVENFGYTDNEKIKPVSDNLDFEFEELEIIIEKRMEQEKMKKKIEKLIWSLQNRNGKNYLIGTIFISGLGMIKVSVDLYKKELIDFEKKSFFDFIKVIKKKKKNQIISQQ